ncbi:unnamed protein product [Merluccius merluccius]
MDPRGKSVGAAAVVPTGTGNLSGSPHKGPSRHTGPERRCPGTPILQTSAHYQGSLWIDLPAAPSSLIIAFTQIGRVADCMRFDHSPDAEDLCSLLESSE